MKRLFYLFLFVFLVFGCKKDELKSLDFRELMREFVEQISQYAKSKESNFIIIPQNGAEILSKYKDRLYPDTAYLKAIDAQAQEDLFYGYNGDNEPTPQNVTEYLEQYLDLAKAFGKKILVTDYCWDSAYVRHSYEMNAQKGYVSFAAPSRELDSLLDSAECCGNNQNISNISQVRNFLYLIDPHKFASKAEFIKALSKTNFDLLIIDAFFNGQEFTKAEIDSLKYKPDGSRRLVIAYMSIGEAEDYRYYWNPQWNTNPPSWLEKPNPNWPGDYKVRYWYPQWKKIIFGTKNSYLDKIMAMDFDGVYLDIIDAYEYFEQKYD